MTARIQRRFLHGSRWTAVAPCDTAGRRHFEVIEVRREHVVLRPILGGPSVEHPIRELEDRARWAVGWRSCAAVRG